MLSTSIVSLSPLGNPAPASTRSPVSFSVSNVDHRPLVFCQSCPLYSLVSDTHFSPFSADSLHQSFFFSYRVSGEYAAIYRRTCLQDFKFQSRHIDTFPPTRFYRPLSTPFVHLAIYFLCPQFTAPRLLASSESVSHLDLSPLSDAIFLVGRRIFFHLFSRSLTIGQLPQQTHFHREPPLYPSSSLATLLCHEQIYPAHVLLRCDVFESVHGISFFPDPVIAPHVEYGVISALLQFC